ncbi:Exodeoxyribonuclease III [Aquicella siphonis]|uniref:Exodeoxyribonuclease III n=1 Tax=Aquicella siphonis TaxID=254247 RepID=A0A5E4PJS7_9COXI|nr:exodeoxyribonuclease III [Aquicella siphonis]VVC76582.1 Exodeoxyribonuclease III [Aquicella siphonis]
MRLFKIATWNVNSLRVRLPHVLAWLKEAKPDVLALQETKLPDADFPSAAFIDAGYDAVFSGQRTYNGVAVISRTKPTDILTDLPGLEDPQRRVLGMVAGDIRVLDLYVPNGESVNSEKYQYKLNWLKKLDLFLKRELQKHPRMIVLGDFNIAPEDIDVHDPALWEGQVLFSVPERKAFKSLLQLGFADCFRQINPQEKSYSWWDYRMNAFRRGMGLRIDHILASVPLASQCVKCYIDKSQRGLERPSDHAPVVAEFRLT